MLTPDAAAFIQSNAPFALDLLRVLARIPAPSCQEEKRVRFCQTLLESWGARSAFVDQAGNLVYPVGDQGDNPLVVFAATRISSFPTRRACPCARMTRASSVPASETIRPTWSRCSCTSNTSCLAGSSPPALESSSSSIQGKKGWGT